MSMSSGAVSEFPDSKTGAKRIPLNSAALEVLDGLARADRIG